MQHPAQRIISFFHAIVLAGVATLLITSAALPMPAQNSAPPTAVQAAKTPQFAKRLAHPATRRMPAKSPVPSYLRRPLPPGFNGIAYDNGPVNGQVDAWTINSGFATTNTVQVMSGGGSITGLNFWAWLIPGDTISNVQVSIGYTPFANDQFNGEVALTQSDCFVNGFGYNVCMESASIANGPVLNGNAWLTLQNASVPSGDPVYWDENSGFGCQSPGCPSQAQESSVGTIPSEAFTLQGNPCLPAEEKPVTGARVVTVPPSPTQSYRVIYNFTGGADGGAPSSGLAIDAAGNLYGTTGYGGPSGGGGVFKLTPSASGWRFNRLYAFSGANGAGPDSTLVRGADGRLYGATYGGGLGNGVLFGLSPAGNILPSVFSNWMETLLYSFTGGSDGASPGGSLALDSSGNIYGNAAMAGANGGGTLYEFSNGAIQVLHAFPAFSGDGSRPIGVVNGSHGLYGITGSGGDHNAGTFYTTAGGYQVLHSFAGGGEGSPTSLAADQAGNLYATSSYSYIICTAPGEEQVYGTSVSQLSPPDWNPFVLENLGQVFGPPLSSSISTDTLENIYGTIDNYGSYSLGNVFKLTCCWNYTDLHDFSGGPNDGLQPEASPVVDVQGNIYGTTLNGGTYGLGVVWEISP
jgi:uncharacterized repeat protein (TIGR03803 family)